MHEPKTHTARSDPQSASQIDVRETWEERRRRPVFRGDQFRGDQFGGDPFRGDPFRGDQFRGDPFRVEGDPFRGDPFRGPG